MREIWRENWWLVGELFVGGGRPGPAIASSKFGGATIFFGDAGGGARGTGTRPKEEGMGTLIGISGTRGAVCGREGT